MIENWWPTQIGSYDNPDHKILKKDLVNYCLKLKGKIKKGGEMWVSGDTLNTSDGAFDVMKDKKFMERLIDRAKEAKCSALVLTLDLQLLGQRHKDIRNGLSTPPKLIPKHVYQVLSRPMWCLRMLTTKNHFFGNMFFK